jgi:hypothetical protein
MRYYTVTVILTAIDKKIKGIGNEIRRAMKINGYSSEYPVKAREEKQRGLTN